MKVTLGNGRVGQIERGWAGRERVKKRLPRDPRLFQIATLTLLLVYGIGWLDFEITAGRAALILAATLVTQACWDRFGPGKRPASVNVQSALISGLSLCLLLRTDY
ncbi:MAG TPA: hypothetical protein VNZ26_22820, partial [Vicinamibacterales bacterium]|nr:hypothetical protein [Vicinamibacterales bacterium]